ncbi:glutathione S-transferase N-terminal domain-containing protein [Pseudomonas fluorescens]|uniref:glutathione S-transferase N-terminal domain-containing protein n=1 Tax=Pseudomonas fluorescens TaxID=294 RepID=UPI000CD0ECA1|nr:glutathione S-transferase N-terminal domain-containing protein [Pseudomonas fluorescens]PNY78787.1 hypothetical protein C1751_01800 [Pseudomonas fluorescens]
MHIYYTLGASCLAPHIVFECLNIPYTRALANKNSLIFKKANPMHAVSTLLVDGTGSIKQCAAILRYQTGLPGGELFGPNPLDPSENYEFDH